MEHKRHLLPFYSIINPEVSIILHTAQLTWLVTYHTQKQYILLLSALDCILCIIHVLCLLFGWREEISNFLRWSENVLDVVSHDSQHGRVCSIYMLVSAALLVSSVGTLNFKLLGWLYIQCFRDEPLHKPLLISILQHLPPLPLYTCYTTISPLDSLMPAFTSLKSKAMPHRSILNFGLFCCIVRLLSWCLWCCRCGSRHVFCHDFEWMCSIFTPQVFLDCLHSWSIHMHLFLIFRVLKLLI